MCGQDNNEGGERYAPSSGTRAAIMARRRARANKLKTLFFTVR
jgi:hypothetical protein